MKNTVVIETYMYDGIDRVYVWSSVEEAINSGRFEYIDFDDEQDFTEDDFYACKSVEELIGLVSYPFEIYEGDLNELLSSPYVKLGLES